jgi:hypothetical protein
MQLSNIYLLACMVGVGVLATTPEPRIMRNYLIALWFADLGYIGLTCHALGWHGLVDVAGWSGITWGNVGVTVGCIGV